MSKFDIKTSHGESGRRVSVTITGKLTDKEWEAFKECLLVCIKRYREKLKITFKGKRYV